MTGNLYLLICNLCVAFIGCIFFIGIEVLIFLDILNVLIRHVGKVFLFFLLKGELILVWNLIIIRMDFRESQEAVAVSAIINESGLKGGFDPRYFSKINIASELPLIAALKIKFFDAGSIDDDHPRFFGVCCIDQHTFCHGDLRWPLGMFAARHLASARGVLANRGR